MEAGSLGSVGSPIRVTMITRLLVRGMWVRYKSSQIGNAINILQQLSVRKLEPTIMM